jgi:hypothetical protein
MGGARSWPILRYCTDICLEVVRKPVVIPILSRVLSRECESEAWNLSLRCAYHVLTNIDSTGVRGLIIHVLAALLY